MIIGVICNLNLVRSPLITSFLSKNFTEHSFFSAGIAATQCYDYPLAVRDISKAWKLPLENRPNKGLNSVKKLIEQADLLLCADNQIFNYFRTHFPEKELLDLQALGKKLNVDVLDPLYMELQEYKLVLAKYLYLATKAMKNILPEPESIVLKIPQNSWNVEDTFYEALKIASGLARPLIIDYNLRVPNLGLVNRLAFNFSVINDLNFQNLTPSPNLIHTFDREFVDPEVTYLDSSWRSMVVDASRSFDLVLVLPPLQVAGKKLHDPYLAALSGLG